MADRKSEFGLSEREKIEKGATSRKGAHVAIGVTTMSCDIVGQSDGCVALRERESDVGC